MRLLVSFLLISLSTMAEHQCWVEKTRLIWDSENGRMNVEQAKTEKFPVVNQQHQDAFVLPLLMKDGRSWGNAEVSTATHRNEKRDTIFCSASISNENSELLAYLTLTTSVDTEFGSSSTFINETDMPPSLKINCEKIAL